MKRIITYILTAALCFSVCGCSSAGGISTFTAAVETMPRNFDPQIASSPEDLMIITNIFDGLFEIVNGEIVNNIAEDCIISQDGRTYTITIKEDNVFRCRGKFKEEHNGTPVTAQDFVFAIKRVLNPDTHSPYINDFSNIQSVSAENNNVIVIRLKTADYNFTEKLAMPAAYPCNEEFFYKTGGAYGLTVDNILSNGPFLLNYLDTEGGNATIIRMTDADNSIERIRIKQADKAEQRTMYDSEEISAYFTSQSVSHSNTGAMSFDSGNICLLFNRNKTVFSNENIRSALGWYAFGFINSGANMSAVNPADSVFPDTVTIAGQYVTDLIDGMQPSYLAADPKKLLTEGFSQLGISRLDSMTVLMPATSPYTLIYENINQLWQKNLGQFFTVEQLPLSELKQRINSGDFDIAFAPLTPDNNTVYGILDRFTPFDSNYKHIVSQAKTMPDQKKAVSLISQAQNILLEKAIVVPMGSEQTYLYYRNYFTDIHADPFTNVINLKYAKVK